MKRLNWGIILSLTAALALSACADEKVPEATESVTVSVTEEVSFTEQTTAAETEKSGILGDYTETTAEVTEAAETEPAEKVTVFGEEYPLDYMTYVVFDADKCSEVTEEDLKNIELLKEWHLSYIDVKNCRDRDLGFLSAVKGIKSMRFWGAEGGSFDWLTELTELESAGFVFFGGSARALADAADKTELKNLYIYDKNFDIKAAPEMHKRFAERMSFFYGSNEGYENGEAPEVPYLVSSPCVCTYENHLHVSYVDRKYNELERGGNFLKAYFCNPTDQMIHIEGVSVVDAFSPGFEIFSSELEADVYSGEELYFDITPDKFDFSSVREGPYNIVVAYDGGKEAIAPFIVKTGAEYPEGANKEQWEVFEKARGYVEQYFGTSVWMTEEYASSHTSDEFISQFTDAMTYELASRFSSAYMDEDGNLKAIGGDRGSTIYLVDHCFDIIYDDDGNGITIMCITTNFHSDFSCGPWLETYDCHMTETPDGWRVDDFHLWW